MLFTFTCKSAFHLYCSMYESVIVRNVSFLSVLESALTFKWTTHDAGGLDHTSPNSRVFTLRLLHEQAVRVHQVKGSTAQELSLRQGLPGIRKPPQRSQPLTLEQGIQQRQLCWISAWVLTCVKGNLEDYRCFNCFKNPKATSNCSYLNIKGVTIKFPELAMLPNPLVRFA